MGGEVKQMELFSLLGKIAINGADAEKEIDSVTGKAESGSSKMGAAFKKVATIAAAIFAGAKMKEFAMDIVEAAANAQAMQAQFEQVFTGIDDSAQGTIDSISDEMNILPNRIKPGFTSIASMFQGVGYSAEESMNIADTAMRLGADGAAFYDKSLETVTDSMKSFILGNTSAGDAIGVSTTQTQIGAWAAKELGYNWDDATEAQKQFARLKFVESIYEQNGAMGQAVRESEAYENVLGNLKQGWVDFQAVLGNFLLDPVVAGMGILTDILQKMTSYVENADTHATSLKETWDKWEPTILAVVGALGVLGVGIAAYNASLIYTWAAVNALTIAEKAAAAAKVAMTVATGGLSTAMAFLISPIGLVTLALAAVVGGLILLYNKSEWFRNVVNAIWSNISSFAQKIWNYILNSILKPTWAELVNLGQAILERLAKFWQKNGDDIKKITRAAYEFIKKYVVDNITSMVNIAKGLFTILQSVAQSVWRNIEVIIQSAVGIILSIVRMFTAAFRGDWQGVWREAQSLLKNAWNLLKNAAQIGVSSLLGVIRGIGRALGGIWADIGNSFYNAGRGFIEQMVKGIEGMVKKVTGAVSKVAQKVRDFLPFSPAKTGPLSDLDHLDFGGPISDSLIRALPEVQSKLEPMLTLPDVTTARVLSRGSSTIDSSTANGTTQDTSTLLEVIIRLLQEIVSKELIVDENSMTRRMDNTSGMTTKRKLYNAGRRI